MLPCHGECNIPEGYLEQQRRLIDEQLREDFIRAIKDRSKLVFGVDMTDEECEAMFEQHVLETGMELSEARQVETQMHDYNARLWRAGPTKT